MLGFVGNHGRNGLTGAKARDAIVIVAASAPGYTPEVPPARPIEAGPIGERFNTDDNKGTP